MPAAPLPNDEARRLAALRALKVLDTADEPVFDALTALASEIAGTPIALISLVDQDRQWFKSRVGLDALQTPREQAFCGYAILGDEPLAVPDATQDRRFLDNPLVTGAPDIRAYLGAPLIGAQGDAYGTLCVIDRKPIDWAPEKVAELQRLATVATQLMEWRAIALETTDISRRKAELADQLEKVAALSGVGGWEFDLESDRPIWSAQTRRIHEVADDFQPELKTAIEFYAPEARPVIAEAVRRCLETGEPFDLELPFVTAKGRRIYVRSLGERVIEAGRPARLRGAFQDVTARREREEALRQAEIEAEAARVRLWNAIEAIPDGFVIYDVQDRLVAANKRYKEIYAASAPSIEPGARFEDILRFGLENGQYPEAAGREDEWLAERLANHRTPKRAIEQEIAGERWLRIHESISENGDVVGFRVDVTETKRAQNQLQEYSIQLEKAKSLAEERNRELSEANAKIAQHAMNDALTGLPNRRRFEQAMREMIADCEGRGEVLALLHVDLDRFKNINDTLGHAAGDEVLKTAAARLSAATRQGDLTARLGGDEFVVVGRLPRGATDATFLGRRIVEALAKPMTVEGVVCDVGASVGAAIAMGPRIDGAMLMRTADMALYQAKEAGRNQAVQFDDALMARRAAAQARADALNAAIEDGRVFAELRPMRIKGVKSLCVTFAAARWRASDGRIGDERDWRAMERSAALVERADLAVIASAIAEAPDCAFAPLYVDTGLPMLRSAKARALAADLSAPLILSIEETALERVPAGTERDRLLTALEDFRRAGGDLAIRGFGDGTGGMSTLALWAPRRVILAPSVVRAAGEGEHGRRMAAALLAGAHAIGVESAAEAAGQGAQTMRDLGCRGIVAPFPAETAPAALKAQGALGVQR